MIALAVNLVLLGSVIAVPLAVALSLARGVHPRLRYFVVLAAFALAAAVPVAMTFVRPSSDGAMIDRAVGPADEGIVRRGAALLWIAVAAALVVRDLAGHAALRRAGEDDGPATVGLFHPRVLIPSALLRTLSAEAAARVVRHEQAHARWRDPLANALVRLVRAALWPSLPLWYLERVIRTEREAAADAEAAGDATEEYAAMLIETARWSRHRRSWLEAGLGGVELEERIERLLSDARPAHRFVGAVILFAALGALAVMPVAPQRRPMPAHAVGDPALDALIAGTLYHDHTATKDVHGRLARLRQRPSLAPLAAALGHHDPRVRESAAWIAGELGDVRAVPLLVPRLRDPDPHTQLTASLALRRLR